MVWTGAAGCSNPCCYYLFQSRGEMHVLVGACCSLTQSHTTAHAPLPLALKWKVAIVVCTGTPQKHLYALKGKYKCRERNKIWILKLLFLPKDVVKRFHHCFTCSKNKREAQKTLLLSATQFAFKFAALCGFWDEQISLLGVPNTPTDLDPYPASANAHALACSIQDTLYVH